MDEQNKTLEKVVLRLLEKVEYLEEKVELLNVEQIVEQIEVPEIKEEKIYLPIEQKVEFNYQRLKFITTEIAKINYEIGNNSLFKDEVTPIQDPVNEKEILVVCANYPHKDQLYGGAFIPARVKAYVKDGFHVTVCIAQGVEGSRKPVIEEHEGVKIYIGDFSLLEERIKEVNPAAIVVHSPIMQNYNTFKKLNVEDRLILIFHGFEVRDVGHLYYNFNDQIMQNLNGILQMDMNRKQVAIDSFKNRKIAKVFVSNFFKQLVTKDIGIAPTNSYVISNLIESDIFNYKAKVAEDRLKIFSVRPYDNKNYAADLIVDTILSLSEKEYFNKLSFYIQGFGKTFAEKTAKLRKFNNVTLVEGILRREEIAALHKKHGVALIPTRFDTQGVSVGEAMSSGLVPITNRVAAIPEFVPENCAMLADDNSIEQLVDGIEKLFYNSELFLEKSFNAAQHIKKICSPENTVVKELILINDMVKK